MIKPVPDSDTIAAISTPPGHGGIGMVRITGPGALDVLRSVFTPRGGWATFPPPPQKALLGHTHFPGKDVGPIDQTLVLFFRGPGSYTGEDTFEVTAHGGPLIMRTILEAALEGGARLAEPGEFTRRAFVNGRIDLSQAEAVAGLIHAATDEARRVMLRQVEGAMGREAGAIREWVMTAKVMLESAIDFPEDVEDDLDLRQVEEAVRNSLDTARGLLSTARHGIALDAGLAVVIIGTPNVGKSSLLNALLEEDRAIVHEVPGTTRDFIEGSVDIQGVPMRVVDTAGIREGADAVEVEGVLRTRRMMENADLLIVVIDSSRKLGPGDKALLQETKKDPRVVVSNKSDLPSQGADLPDEAIPVSAKTGDGIGGLKSAIYRAAFGNEGESLALAEGVVTTVRQAEAVKGIKDACERALRAVKERVEPDLIAVDVNEALLHVGELTGQISDEEVLDRIFTTFCIGK